MTTNMRHDGELRETVVIAAGPTRSGRSRATQATLVGPEVAELLHAATVAVVRAVPMHLLLESVAPLPTRSEIWLTLLERYEVERRLGSLARAA
jgi:hypothetical protein